MARPKANAPVDKTAAAASFDKMVKQRTQVLAKAIVHEVPLDIVTLAACLEMAIDLSVYHGFPIRDHLARVLGKAPKVATVAVAATPKRRRGRPRKVGMPEQTPTEATAVQ